MSLFISAAGKNTPEIRFDCSGNKYFMKGKSFPENSKKHFLPLIEWLAKNKLPSNAVIELQFDYISSSSVIAVLEVLKKIEGHSNSIVVTWTYEEGDDDLRNVGLNYQKLCSLNFEFIELKG